MHFFALFLFLALGVAALTMVGERLYRRLSGGRALMAGFWGVGLAWLADLNMWVGWGIGHLRYAWVGVTLTGVALGGAALLVYALVSFFFGLRRKLDDESTAIERSSELRRVA